jgi:hypothetical protein
MSRDTYRSQRKGRQLQNEEKETVFFIFTKIIVKHFAYIYANWLA